MYRLEYYSGYHANDVDYDIQDVYDAINHDNYCQQIYPTLDTVTIIRREDGRIAAIRQPDGDWVAIPLRRMAPLAGKVWDI